MFPPHLRAISPQTITILSSRVLPFPRLVRSPRSHNTASGIRSLTHKQNRTYVSKAATSSKVWKYFWQNLSCRWWWSPMFHQEKQLDINNPTHFWQWHNLHFPMETLQLPAYKINWPMPQWTGSPSLKIKITSKELLSWQCKCCTTKMQDPKYTINLSAWAAKPFSTQRMNRWSMKGISELETQTDVTSSGAATLIFDVILMTWLQEQLNTMQAPSEA